MNPPFIFLANGKVHFVNYAGQSFPLESAYAADLTAKALKAQERHGWKNENGNNFLSGPRLWGKGEPEPLAIHFTSIAPGRTADEFLYTLRTSHLCAICSVKGEAAEEQRLWNHQSRRLAYLHVHPTLGHIVCSSEKPNGSAHILIRHAEDAALSEVTEGDSVDTAPSWIPGDGLRIVFQSGGIGRNKEGVFGGIGPFAIQQLNVESGELTTLAQESRFDLLTPRVALDGALYYIKRPYTGTIRASFWDVVKDFFLFPFRLGHAVFGFLNIFTMLYSGRQLKTVKTADAQQMPIPQMILFGNLLKAQQPDANNPNPGLVPESWQLIRKRPSAAEEILATRVLCFDVADDGAILFSNGIQITVMTPDGRKERVGENTFVQQVAFLRGAVANSN
jgi:hypothetical protein